MSNTQSKIIRHTKSRPNNQKPQGGKKKKKDNRKRYTENIEFPGGLVVTQCFHCFGPGSIPGLGTEIPHEGVPYHG